MVDYGSFRYSARPRLLSASDRLILRGLQAPQAALPPKMFYDRLGSTLFTSICLVPEYYQTRTEAVIFEEFSGQMAAKLPRHFRMVDLGAGDCRKAAGLFAVLKPALYTPIDISDEFLDVAAENIRAEFPQVIVEPLVRDFTSAWELPPQMLSDEIVYFYPGSSIGNFDPPDAVKFLKNLRTSARRSCQILIGVDTVKAVDVLESAYDDALGVTAAFNRNALLNANRQLGTNFDASQWAHRSIYNADKHRIEMHLVAREELLVNWPGGERKFFPSETIHTENSYKYSGDSFGELLICAGFSLEQQWQDSAGDFLVVLAKSDN